MAAFSRVQLAAALLEYDNDFQNPAAPYRSAQESAIFLPLRRNATVQRQHASRRGTDYLGIALPSDRGSVSGRESTLSMGHKKSGSSIHALRNPFGGDGADEEDDSEKEGLDVDLASWGLDAFLPEDKATVAKAKSDSLPNPHTRPVVGLRQGTGGVVERGEAETRGMGRRTRSMGNFDFGEGGAFLDAQSSSLRPKSVADPLDMSDFQPYQAPFQRRRASSHALIEGLSSKAPLHTVPFPSSDSRANSPLPYDNGGSPSRPISRGSGFLLDEQRPHRRTNSGSSRKLLDEENNIFAVRPPSPERASRFDPKSNRARTHSNATMGTMATRNLHVDEDNAFAISLPSPSRSSRFDPKMAAHARTMSNASLGSRMLLENDGVSMLGGASLMSGRPMTTQDRPFSSIDLLRPKVLIMPSPLQGVDIPEPQKVREGFRLSTSGPPLPPGARTSRPISATYDQLPVTSHMFTPNPRLNLSLAQLAFRNTLLVGGERDVAYSDIDRVLPRATEDGEQMQLLDEEEAEINDDYGVEEQPRPVFANEPIQTSRPAGKLFGKSLIDDLESRKLNMRSKQRVFKGDDRPSMMNRGLQRSGTLIDPESLQRPVSGTFQPPAALGRRNSTKGGPLLTFDDNLPGNASFSPNPRVQNGHSVFGTDTLWEREMKKLKQIEAEEKAAKESEEAKETQSTDKKKRSKGKTRKGKGKFQEKQIEMEEEQVTTPMAEEKEGSSSKLRSFIEPPPRVSAEPPVLPAIEKPIIRGPLPPVNDYDTESDSDASIKPATSQARRDSTETAAARWVAGSSDEDQGPVRTTGVGLRNRKQSLPKTHLTEDDSDEDIPLSISMGRALQRVMPAADDSDEDRPLSTMFDKPKMGIPPINFDKLSLGNGRDNEDDDQPLGLRASRILPSQGPYAGEDDDDKPLALHPDQQRRTQYQAMAQQQQMIIQAQIQQSMFFGPHPMMNTGFYGPSMAPVAPVPPPIIMGPMMAPQPISPPSVGRDSAKYGRVDRWRHDVAVEEHSAS